MISELTSSSAQHLSHEMGSKADANLQAQHAVLAHAQRLGDWAGQLLVIGNLAGAAAEGAKAEMNMREERHASFVEGRDPTSVSV